MIKIKVFEAFAGYGSQAMALKRLKQDYPDKVDFEFVGISEIEPNAIKAYNAIHGETKNFGDITKINWGGANTGLRFVHLFFPLSRHQQCRITERIHRGQWLKVFPFMGM